MKGVPNEYLKTVERLEPDIHPVDASAFYASTSISLKRIADRYSWDAFKKRSVFAAGVVAGVFFTLCFRSVGLLP